MFRGVGLERLPTQCLFFENGIAVQSVVIQAVAVCFGYFHLKDPAGGNPVESEKRQYLVAVAMSEEQMPYREVKAYFHALYGEPVAGTEDVWTVRSRDPAGQPVQHYVFLKDGDNTEARNGRVSAVALYVNTSGLTEVYTDLFEQLEKRQKKVKRCRR